MTVINVNILTKPSKHPKRRLAGDVRLRAAVAHAGYLVFANVYAPLTSAR